MNIVGPVETAQGSAKDGDELMDGAKLKVPPGAACDLIWEEPIATLSWEADQPAPAFHTNLSAGGLTPGAGSTTRLMFRKTGGQAPAPGGTPSAGPLSALGGILVAQGETYEVVRLETLAELRWPKGKAKPQFRAMFPPANCLMRHHRKGTVPARYELLTPAGAILIRAEP